MSNKFEDFVEIECRRDPEMRGRIEREKARLLGYHNRPWWRVLRWWDRRRGR